ncbi:energy transducer TonB [Stenotrophomonas maltophilia]|nr:energy transducer TonB [Stenotrophomonas maltophilia]
MRKTGLFSVAVAALLFTGCSTLPKEAGVASAGCSMLPQGLRYIDARVQVAQLMQDRGGCHLHAVAKNAAVAHAQKVLLGRLAERRCGNVIVSDSSEGVAAQDTDATGVTMRITLRTASGKPCAGLTALEENEQIAASAAYKPYSTHARPPRYPSDAYREGRQGEASVIILVAGQGQTIGAVLERSSGHDDLDEAAVTAAQDWRFDGHGKPPETTLIRVPVNFVLN